MGPFKEFLQNADDAKARKFAGKKKKKQQRLKLQKTWNKIVVFDRRTHKHDSCLTPNLKEYQGPALLFYNDSVFSDDDFANITSLGKSQVCCFKKEGKKKKKKNKTNQWKENKFEFFFFSKTNRNSMTFQESENTDWDLMLLIILPMLSVSLQEINSLFSMFMVATYLIKFWVKSKKKGSF